MSCGGSRVRTLAFCPCLQSSACCLPQSLSEASPGLCLPNPSLYGVPPSLPLLGVPSAPTLLPESKDCVSFPSHSILHTNTGQGPRLSQALQLTLNSHPGPSLPFHLAQSGITCVVRTKLLALSGKREVSGGRESTQASSLNTEVPSFLGVGVGSQELVGNSGLLLLCLLGSQDHFQFSAPFSSLTPQSSSLGLCTGNGTHSVSPPSQHTYPCLVH